MSNHVTTVLLWLPYVAGVLLWAKCMSFARSHSVDLQAVTKRGSVHWLAFPVVCLVTGVTTIGLAVTAQNKHAGIGLFLLLLGSLVFNLYFAYTVVFHVAWVASAVFGLKHGTDALAQLEAAFAKHQRHKRFLALCFGIVAGLFAVGVALLAITTSQARFGMP